MVLERYSFTKTTLCSNLYIRNMDSNVYPCVPTLIRESIWRRRQTDNKDNKPSTRGEMDGQKEGTAMTEGRETTRYKYLLSGPLHSLGTEPAASDGPSK